MANKTSEQYVQEAIDERLEEYDKVHKTWVIERLKESVPIPFLIAKVKVNKEGRHDSLTNDGPLNLFKGSSKTFREGLRLLIRYENGFILKKKKKWDRQGESKYIEDIYGCILKILEDALFEYKGKKKTLADWAKVKKPKRSYELLYNRIYRLGWTIETAITTPNNTKQSILSCLREVSRVKPEDGNNWVLRCKLKKIYALGITEEDALIKCKARRLVIFENYAIDKYNAEQLSDADGLTIKDWLKNNKKEKDKHHTEAEDYKKTRKAAINAGCNDQLNDVLNQIKKDKQCEELEYDSKEVRLII